MQAVEHIKSVQITVDKSDPEYVATRSFYAHELKCPLQEVPVSPTQVRIDIDVVDIDSDGKKEPCTGYAYSLCKENKKKLS